MKKLFYFFLICIPFFAQGQAIEATVIGRWDDESIPESIFGGPYQDVWGAVVNGREISIVTSTAGLHFFDLSGETPNMEPVAFVPGADQGTAIGWRDVKTYLHYAYAVSDAGASTLQVIDMSGLPDAVEIVYDSDEFFANRHNIFIDEANARLYAVGGFNETLQILSLDDPEQPELMASFPNDNLSVPYIHDLYVRDNIAYLNAAYLGLMVVDLSDPDNPELLGTMTEYIEQGYNHSGWLSEDGQHYFLCDETHGTDIKVVDVSDLSNIHVVSTMNAQSFPGQIAHNVYPYGNLLHVSYYFDGLQVFDVSNPRFPRKVAYYDTYEGPNSSFSYYGAWGVFVLPSGRVLVSDMANGLFFYEAIEPLLYTSVTANLAGIEACVGETVEFLIEVGTDFSSSGVTLNTDGTSPILEIQLSSTQAMPGEVVQAHVTLLQTGAGYLVINATDGVSGSELQLNVSSFELTEPALLTLPADGAVDAPLRPLFRWEVPSNSASKSIQISTDPDDFEENIFFEAATLSQNFFLTETLEEWTTYYWRVLTTSQCGDLPSSVFSFTTRGTVGTEAEIAGNGFQLYPNPASGFLQIAFNQPLGETLQVECVAANGQPVQSTRMDRYAQFLQLDTSGLPDGLYWLRLANSKGAVSRKIIVQR
ncbi:MAG: choice-of-anchor B family protein [Phaeodactylibacter sp.]|nr:choice-of-anchor B family protein [Phaeodactylibacter sp.]